MQLKYLKASFYNGIKGQPLSSMTKIRVGYCPMIIAENNAEWSSLTKNHSYVDTDAESAELFYENTGYDVQSLFCPAYFRSSNDRGLANEHATALPNPLLIGYPMTYPTDSNIVIVIEDDPDHYICSGKLRNTWVQRDDGFGYNQPNLYNSSDGSTVGHSPYINTYTYGDVEYNHCAESKIIIAKQSASVFEKYGYLEISRYLRTGAISILDKEDPTLLAIMNGYNPLDPDQIEETVLVPVLWNSSYKPEKYQAFARLKRLISL